MSQADSVFKEFRNWCITVDRTQDRSQREPIARILNEVELVYLQMSRLDVSSLGSLAEAFGILDTTAQAVDRLWTSCPQYTEEQLTNFMTLIGKELQRFVLEELQDLKIFDISAPTRTLSQCYRLVAKWNNQTSQFTVSLWPKFVGRKWTGGEYSNPELDLLCKRLEFFDNYQRSFFSCVKFTDSFLPPQMGPLTDYLSSDEGNWESSTKSLLGNLESLAGSVVSAISDSLKQMNDSQDALADELYQLRFLKQFSSFQRVFNQYEERRNNQFVAYLELLKKQVSTRYTNEQDDPGGICDAVKWFSYQLTYTKEFRKKIMEPTDAVTNACNSVTELFEKSIGEMVTAWQTAISKTLGGIDFDENMIKYEANPKTRIMQLSFPTEMDQILQQAAVFTSLNFRLTREVDANVRRLREHRQYFCALKQACDYFNATVIGVIRPLRPLLIPYVDGFISTFGGISNMSFAQHTDVEQFISNVMKAADELADTNTQLMAVHHKFISDIAGLFDCSLISADHRWKETLRACRNQLADIYRSGKTNIKMWMKHLNAQIYKALDFQFEKTLATMERDVQEIQISVVYNRPDIVFEPSIANLRQQLYAQIGRLVAVPTHFGGVSFQSTSNEFASQFAVIVKYHLGAIDELYKRTEVLIEKVTNCTKKFNQWEVLGKISDFDETLKTTLVDQSQFLTNLNSITMREAEIEKIPDTEKFEFITVSYTIVKNSFRRLVGEFKRAVCSVLRKSLEDDISTVMDFINNSLAAIQTQVQSSDEVKRVRETIVSLNGKINEFSKVFRTIRDKSNLLMIHDPQSRQSLQFQIDSISSHWLIFQGSLTDQSKVVQQQVRTLKTLMNQKVDDFQRRTTQFRIKWEERKPKEVDFKDQAAVEKAIQVVKETRIALADFEKEREMLGEEEQSFGVKSNKQFRDIEEVATKALADIIIQSCEDVDTDKWKGIHVPEKLRSEYQFIRRYFA